MNVMTKPHPEPTDTVVRDPATGRFVTVRGVGVLEGRLKIKTGVDLTKPIAAQVLKGSTGRDGATRQRKR